MAQSKRDTFDKYVLKLDTGCWEWTGYREKGYGRFRGQLAHRIAYKRATGRDPGSLFVCHVCDNPPCVNPEHLWLGTNRDNQSDASIKGRARGQDATHCVNGHEYTPENTYWKPGKIAQRTCRTCIRAWVAAYKRRKKAEAA